MGASDPAHSKVRVADVRDPKIGDLPAVVLIVRRPINVVDDQRFGFYLYRHGFEAERLEVPNQ
jgi:hypothetical protein